MAQNITLLGANYTAVPAVTLPKTGGGSATFTDTSDANATADDILEGKTAYVNGVKLTGTGQGGGGGSTTVDIGSDGKAWYINAAGQAQTVTCNPPLTTITCLSGSLITVVYDSKMSDATNATLVELVPMGSRANYRFVDIYQAN